MSRRCVKKEVAYRPMIMPQVGASSCCCSFPTLVILILIVLQFSRYGGGCCDGDGDGDGDGGYSGRNWPVGNGILFIIALFFLTCCNPCRPGIGGFGGGYGAY